MVLSCIVRLYNIQHKKNLAVLFMLAVLVIFLFTPQLTIYSTVPQERLHFLEEQPGLLQCSVSKVRKSLQSYVQKTKVRFLYCFNQNMQWCLFQSSRSRIIQVILQCSFNALLYQVRLRGKNFAVMWISNIIPKNLIE